MSFDGHQTGTSGYGVEDGGAAESGSPGKRTMSERLPVQRQATPAASAAAPMAASHGGSDPFGLHLLDARGGSGGNGVEDNRPPADAGPAPAGPAAPAAATPTPIALRNGPTHAAIDAGDRIGMSIAITVTSSNGVDADMSRIQDSEKVGMSINHTGSCSTLPSLPSNQSGFMAGHPIPDDQHAWSKAAVIDRADNHGGNGSFEKEQLDVYTDAAAGVAAPVVIPNSGYIIKRTIIKGAGTLVQFRTEKRPAAVTVGAFTTAAGPSATQGDTVTARA